VEAKELIIISLEQSQRFLTNALDGLTQEETAWSPNPECNSIAFILWYVTRVEDTFVNCLIQCGKELYEAEGWQEKLGPQDRLPICAGCSGAGQVDVGKNQ